MGAMLVWDHGIPGNLVWLALLTQMPASGSASENSLQSTTLKRPISPISEASISKRAVSEENPSHSFANTMNTTRAIFPPLRPPQSPPPVLPSSEEQLFQYHKASAIPMQKGQTWYLLNCEWFQRWEQACDSATANTSNPTKLDENPDPITIQNLGVIDNTELIDSENDLKPNLSIGIEIEIVPEQFWLQLSSWYGYKPCAIPRRVIAPSGLGSESLEFYPPRFHFYLIGSFYPSALLPPSPVRTRISIGLSIAELKHQLAQDLFDPLLTRPLRLWRLPFAPPPEIYDAPVLTLENLTGASPELIQPSSEDADLNEALLTDPDNYLVVEQLTKEGTWLVLNSEQKQAESEPIGFGGSETWLAQMDRMNQINKLDPKYKTVPSLNGSAEASSSKGSAGSLAGGLMAQLKRATGLGGAENSSTVKSHYVKGLVGLSNLGNTCFMNSALQCMSNCPELNQYFLSGVYTSELNRINPLGMGGKVAETFGQLIEKLWTINPQTCSSVAPREFKSIVGRFNSLFLGYGQQDSQELLTFLLDALHEDLNRVLKKPFDEIPDFKDGDGDEELVKLAHTCWELYRRRNDSVIVDLFQGQYKSTLVCPDCQKIAIKFDEIMYLTLQLPVHKKHKGAIYFIPLDPTKPRLKVIYSLPKDSTIRHLRRHIGQILGYDHNNMLVLEDWSGKPWKVWQDTDSLETMLDRDVLNIYETPSSFTALRTGSQFDPSSGYVIVPVVSYRPAEKGFGLGGSNSIHRGGKSFSAFGVSFLVFLKVEKVLRYEDIYDAVVSQYARYTKKPEELLEDSDDQVKTADGDVDVEMQSAPLLPAAAKAVPNLFRISVPAQPTPTVIPTSQSMGVTTVALEERELNGRKGLFKKVGEGNLSLDVEAEEDLYGGSVKPEAPEAESKVMEDEEPAIPKAEDEAAKHERPTKGGGPIKEEERAKVGEPAQVMGQPEDPANAAEESGVEQGTEKPMDEDKPAPAPTELLVRQGDFFECEWNTASMTHFFGDRTLSESRGWNDPEVIEDPSIAASAGAARKTLTIEDCFKDFSKPEQLGEDDKWFCPRCKDHVQAIKTMQIWKVPDILVVHFKRFSNARTAYGRSTKVEEYVDFPIEGLDLTKEVEGYKVARRLDQGMEEESLVYDLFAVDNHFGGLGGGHYTAFAKNAENGKWYNFDDSHVSEVGDAEKIKTSAAYLLFYRRRTSNHLGSKTHQIVTKALESSASSCASGPAIVRAPISPVSSGPHETQEGASDRCMSPSSNRAEGLESPKASSIFELDSPPSGTPFLLPTPPPAYGDGLEDESEIVYELKID